MTTTNDIKTALSKNDAAKASLLDSVIQSKIDTGPTDLDATWDEINAVADMSAHVLAPATGDLTLTAATHGNKIVYYDDADGTVTLPAATGTGYTYKIVLKTAFTAGAIQVANATDSFLGGINGVDDDADAAYAWKAETDDDKISGNGTSTGGKAGDWYEFIDVASGKFLVSGFITQSGGSEATPFSAAVS